MIAATPYALALVLLACIVLQQRTRAVAVVWLCTYAVATLFLFATSWPLPVTLAWAAVGALSLVWAVLLLRPVREPTARDAASLLGWHTTGKTFVSATPPPRRRYRTLARTLPRQGR